MCQQPDATSDGRHGCNAGRHAGMLDAKCHHRAPFYPLRMSALKSAWITAQWLRREAISTDEILLSSPTDVNLTVS
jgi:hypothetical protein